MKVGKNSVTGLLEITGVPAVVLAISDKVLELNNDKATKYRMGAVSVNINGSKQQSPARFYQGILDINPLAKGDECTISIQAEGEYKGRAVVEILGGSGVDVDALLAMVKAPSSKEELKAVEELETDA